MKKKVLIGSVLNQSAFVLQNFLLSLMELEKAGLEIDYLFIGNTNEALPGQFKPVTGDIKVFDFSVINAGTTDRTWQIAAYNNFIIDHSKNNNYDFLFLLNSDLILHPATLGHLLALDRDIVGEVYWTTIQENVQIPQVLPSLQVYFLNEKYGEVIDVNQFSTEQIKFMEKLKIPGLYEVAEISGCLLLGREVLHKEAVSFSQIKNLSFTEPAAHFSLRAVAAGYQLFADTSYPPLHLFQITDPGVIEDFKAAFKVKHPQQVQESLIKVKKGQSLSLKEYRENCCPEVAVINLEDYTGSLAFLPVYRLDNALLAFNGLIISREGFTIKDSFVRERHIKDYSDNLEANFYSDNQYIFIRGEQCTYLDGEYVSLIGPWAGSFWHWMVEFLAKVVIAETSGFQGKYIIFPEAPFMLESLSLMGIGENRLLIIDSPKNFLLQSLYLNEMFAMYHGEQVLTALKLLREKLIGTIPAAKVTSRRIYISRQFAANFRRIANEEEIIRVLEKFDFQIVFMEKLSLREQIALMAETDHLIGGNGAGMLHSLFMPEKSMVTELFAPTYTTSAMLPVMELQKHKYYMITSPTAGEYKYGSGVDASIYIPPDLLRITLENHQYKNRGYKAKNFFITNRDNKIVQNFIGSVEMHELLEKYNFQTIYAEGLAGQDLAALLADAGCLISDNEAGVNASLFMPPASLIIQLFAPEYINPVASTVIESLKHRYVMLTFPHREARNYIPGRDFTPGADMLRIILQNHLTNN